MWIRLVGSMTLTICILISSLVRAETPDVSNLDFKVLKTASKLFNSKGVVEFIEEYSMGEYHEMISDPDNLRIKNPDASQLKGLKSLFVSRAITLALNLVICKSATNTEKEYGECKEELDTYYNLWSSKTVELLSGNSNKMIYNICTNTGNVPEIRDPLFKINHLMSSYNYKDYRYVFSCIKKRTKELVK